MDWYRLGQRFSIRTYHVGAVSVLLGSLLLGSPIVQAEENVSLDSQPAETVVEEVAKAEETVLVPASTEASVTPAEAPSTDTAVADDLEKASLEIQEVAKATAVDTAVTEEKPVATSETTAVEASPQEDKPALTVKEPTKVPVGNVNALTENEKAEVRANVLAVNETATDVVVADNGQVTLYFGEKTATLASSQVVKQKPVASRRVLRSADTETSPTKTYIPVTIGNEEFSQYLTIIRHDRNTGEEVSLTNEGKEVILIPDNTYYTEARVNYKDKVSLLHDFSFDADVYIGDKFDGITRGDMLAFSFSDEENPSSKNILRFEILSWHSGRSYVDGPHLYPIGRIHKLVSGAYTDVSSERNTSAMPETDSSWKEIDKNLVTAKYANLLVRYSANDKMMHITFADKEWHYSIADLVEANTNPEKEFDIKLDAMTGFAFNEHKFKFNRSSFSVGIHIPVIPIVSVQNAAGTQNNIVIVRGEPNATIKLYQNGQEIGQAPSDENGVAHIHPTTPLLEKPITARSSKVVNGAEVLSDESNAVIPFQLRDPEKVLVDNPQQLSPTEKAKIEQAIQEANPTVPIQSVAVSDTGEATLTYTDGTTSPVVNYGPDKTIAQKDSAKYNPTASAGEAIIDGSDTPNSPLSPADQEVVKGKVDTTGLPQGTRLEPAGTVGGTADNPVVPVTVRYPDGTTDTVDVPVKQKDNAKYDPVVGQVTKPETDPVTAQDVTNQVTAPNGTQLTDKQVKGDLPTTVGTHNVPVEVTYPDGTKEIVNVPVEITDVADKDQFDPIVGKVTKPETDPVTAQDVTGQVTAPNGTQLTDKQVKGDLPTMVGTHNVPVEVTYPDGTKEIVNVPVEITDVADKDQFDPIVGKVTKPETDPVTPQDVTDQVTAPNGTQLTDKQVKGDLPTTVGTHNVPVEVTYPDGTKEIVNVPVEITKGADNATNEPQLKPDAPNTPAVSAGKALIDGSDTPESPLSPADQEAVKDKVDTSNLPTGTTVTPADKVSGTPDNPVVEVTVTYPDGTTDTINVPVKQKDSAINETSVKADEPNTPAVSAGKALIDGSDTPESPLSPADQETVKDKVDTSNLPAGTTVTPADKVSGTPENPVVEVTVTYPDGTTDTIEVPVKQKDSAVNEPSVKADEPNTPTVSAGKALIDGSDTPESPLSDADKAVVADKVDTSNLPAGTTVTPADKVSGTPENPVVEVTVTYPDGTTDTIAVPVKQKDSATNEPTVKPDEANTPTVSAGKALIDGSDTPNSPLTDADKEAVKDKVDTSNLPAGTTVTPADKVTGTPDNPVVEVTVTYPDRTTDTINVPVKQKDSASNEPTVKPDEANTPTVSAGKALIDGSDTPESPLSDADKALVADKVDTSKLPEGTVVTPADKVGGTADNPVVPVTVTYPDGTTDTIDVPVKQKDSATNEPTVKPDEANTPTVSAGKALIDGFDTPESPLSDADKAVVADKVDTSNLPQGTVVTPADKVSGTPDNPVVEVTVTYPDGTTDIIEVPVKQKDSATNEPSVKADEPNTPAISAGKALIDGSDTPNSPLTDADKEAVKDKVDTSKLPDGTTVTPADKVTGTPDNPVVEVTVTYPDGTTDTIEVPVKQKDSATNEPSVKPDEINTPTVSAGKALIDGSDKPNSPLSPADQEAVKDKVDTSKLPDGTTVTPADKVTGTPDNPVVEVTVTYPDGTTDTVNIPVKQKDSASNEPTVKPDETGTPEVSAGKALIDGSDTPESPLSPADQEAVKDKVDTSNLPAGTTVTPADKVTGTPENPVVEVTVTYPDGTTDTINVPVKQKDSATNEPSVKADEPNTPAISAGKALIDGSDAPESPLSPADQEAVKDKVDTSKLPDGTTLTPADKVSGTEDSPVVSVTVTYPDGTTDTIAVPVKQKDSATNEPTVKPDGANTPAVSAGKALIDGSDTPESPLSPADQETVKDKVDTSNLPAGTTVTPADKVTGTPENPIVEVTVTYPDGTTDTIEVPVKQKDSATNEPTVKPDEANTPTVSAGKALIDGSDVPESPLSPADQEAVKDKVDTSNLPAGTTVTPADKVSGTPENPVVEVTVTYPDGTTDTVNIPVKQKDSASNEPSVKADEPNTPAISAGKALIDGSDKPNSPLTDADKEAVKDKVDTSKLPDGTTVTPADKVTGTPDNPAVEVTVTYPDGTTDTVNIPVKQKDSASNEPTVKPDADGTPEISAGKALIDGSGKPNSPLTDADKEAVKDKVDTSNLPAGTTVTPADKVSGTPENPVVEVTVTYPDGTTDTIAVPVKQKDSASNEPTVKPDADGTPEISAGKVLIDGSDTPESPLSPADQEAVKDKVDTNNLPEGTVVTPADKVTGTEANPVVEVTVTYPDGTTDTIEVPVKQKDSASNEPAVKPDEANTPAISAGKALIDGSDTPESPLSDTDKAVVADKVDTSNLPEGTIVTPADKVSGTPDNPVVEVTVTYPDGTTDTVNIPVKQKDSASNEPTVKPDADGTPEISAGKALIDGSDKPNSPLTDADKEAVKDKVDTSKLPDGTTVTLADKVTGTPDNPVVEVTVTYPDGTTDTVNIPVKQKDSASNEPTVKPDADGTPEISAGKALIDGSDTPESPLSDADKAVVTDKVDTSNLPQGTVVTPADKVSGTPDNPVVQVTVTYPDGTTDIIEVPVKQKDSMVYQPQLPSVTEVGNVNQLTDQEKEQVKEAFEKANPQLPAGTKIFVSDKGSLAVIFPDGSGFEIDGAYIVRGKNTPAPQAGEVKPVSLAGQDQIRKQAQLPNTGESSVAGTQVAGLLTVLGTSLFWLMSKGRKEEE
ncbi:hypothetical protein BU200_00595 [Streptococcus acidominimus]|uniref:C protein alpha-antigen n=3 Tax=Streptococcus acidominimus TaxID=1326 RepID=A0A1Q8EG34_STRAI|nr:Rib/alpha-like domain-containing protein [Streptococcus acidominimus]OLF50716.1 hypothetical protein BU200_00595 [Streptococcus acidominimus]SUN07603.1 C protein alpha-antigen [Streptococcus acidominimus]